MPIDSVLGLLGVAFVVLKLCHVIDWSWWWVTCPFWGGLAVVVVILIGMGIVVLCKICTKPNTNKREK